MRSETTTAELTTSTNPPQPPVGERANAAPTARLDGEAGNNRDKGNRSLVRAASLASLASLILVTATFLSAEAVSGELTLGAGDTAQVVSLANVIGSMLAGAVFAFGLALGLRRFSRHPRTAFTATCLIGVAAYGAVPFLAGADATTGLWLNAMHVAVAVPLVLGIRSALAKTRR